MTLDDFSRLHRRRIDDCLSAQLEALPAMAPRLHERAPAVAQVGPVGLADVEARALEHGRGFGQARVPRVFQQRAGGEQPQGDAAVAVRHAAQARARRGVGPRDAAGGDDL